MIFQRLKCIERSARSLALRKAQFIHLLTFFRPRPFVKFKVFHITKCSCTNEKTVGYAKCQRHAAKKKEGVLIRKSSLDRDPAVLWWNIREDAINIWVFDTLRRTCIFEMMWSCRGLVLVIHSVLGLNLWLAPIQTNKRKKSWVWVILEGNLLTQVAWVMKGLFFVITHLNPRSIPYISETLVKMCMMFANAQT